MDTFKDKQRLDDMNAQGDCPWEVWRGDQSASPSRGNTGPSNGRGLSVVKDAKAKRG
jgi:hypothetical protein